MRRPGNPDCRGLRLSSPGELHRELAKSLDSGEEKGAALLCCDGCGFIGCWSVSVHIREKGEAILWENFRHNHRDWEYLLSFRFEVRTFPQSLEGLRAPAEQEGKL